MSFRSKSNISVKNFINQFNNNNNDIKKNKSNESKDTSYNPKKDTANNNNTTNKITSVYIPNTATTPTSPTKNVSTLYPSNRTSTPLSPIDNKINFSNQYSPRISNPSQLNNSTNISTATINLVTPAKPNSFSFSNDSLTNSNGVPSPLINSPTSTPSNTPFSPTNRPFSPTNRRSNITHIPKPTIPVSVKVTASNSDQPLLRKLSSSFIQNGQSDNQVVLRSKKPEDSTDSRIPINGSYNLSNEIRWKQKFEDAEKKRKEILAQSEKNARELSKLNKKYDQLNEENKNILKELAEKNELLVKLQTASKEFYKEYDTLKNKYDIETDAYKKAIQQSSKWYRENKKIKRTSAILMQKFNNQYPNDTSENDLRDDVDMTNSLVDYSSSNTNESDSESEIDALRKTIQELSEQVARLQTELNAAKLLEFEAIEQAINLNQKLDFEQKKCSQLEIEIKKLKEVNQDLTRVSKMVTSEVENLKQSAQRDRESVVILRNEADTAKKERNVLAHQSALLMSDLITDATDDRFFKLMQEIENLKTQLEDQQNLHDQQIFELQEKIECNESEGQVEILEEKLKIIENELQQALERADKAEKECEKLKTPPIPPPPPPPPMNLPMPISFKLKTTSDCQNSQLRNNAVEDMEKLLGIDNNSAKRQVQPPGAIVDVINQIKDGKFTLKSTEKKSETPKKPIDEPPAAVKEMLNVLGTLRRRQKSRPSLGDIQFK